MPPTNTNWANLKEAISLDEKPTWWALFFATLVIPNAVAILTNVWTGSGYLSSVGVALGCFVLMQIIFGIVLLRKESKNRSAVGLLADVNEERCLRDSVLLELKRRTEAFKLVRLAFERLSQVPCTASISVSENDWYEKAFCRGLNPVMKPLVDNVQLVLGVKSQRFSLEIFLCGGATQFPTTRSNMLLLCHS